MKAIMIQLKQGEKLYTTCGHDNNLLFISQNFANEKSGYVEIFCPRCFEETYPEIYKSICLEAKG